MYDGRASDSEPRCPCSSIIKGAVLRLRARRINFPQVLGYALVICNHGPHPRGRAGVAVEMGGALTKVMPRQCGGNTRGLLS